MRKILLSLFAACAALTSNAQSIVSTFEGQPLTGADTFYINLSAVGTDVGFEDGAAYFKTVYDSAGGYIWWSGWAYSNMTDSVTSGYMNEYSAKTAAGYNSSSKYAISYGSTNWVKFTDTGDSRTIDGFYITNTTYAYNSMRDGDFSAKKFGGATGSDSDWFKITVRAYHMGVEKTDSVEFFLADFRDANNANDYIVDTWEWVDLSSLGTADSLLFTLTSSDTGQWGMNTPAYFAADNFTVTPIFTSVNDVRQVVAKIYPNPVADVFTLELENAANVNAADVYDLSGKLLQHTAVTQEKTQVSLQHLPAGAYVLQLSGNGVKKGVRITKQ